jgi:CubicO group peptidase (beta-lactamase class C family)
MGSLGLATMIYLPGCKPGTDGVGKLISPESQGVASQGLVDFLKAANESGLEFHSIMVNRNGKTILEGWWNPFRKEYVHTLYSLSKSFTSTAVGLLYDEGKIDVNTPVISFFPDKLPQNVSDNLSAMRVYDLLTMHTGHNQDTMGRMRESGDNDWVRAFLQLEVPLAPGSTFLYNTGATYMLSAIVQKVSGQKTFDYLKPRLFEPLGIIEADWEEDQQGINVGGYGLRVKTEDILNFGQLYLQMGNWNGKQLLSEAWIADATRKQVDSQDNDSDWGQGYGYQFWRCKPGCYRGDGAFGQYCIVVPDKNAVIAITSESKDMGLSMQLVWDHILPAMTDGELPEAEVPFDSMLQEAKNLSLPVHDGSADTQVATSFTGSYQFDQNEFNAETVSFAFQNDVCTLTFTENGKSIPIAAGMNRWITENNHREPGTLFPIGRRTTIPTKVAAFYYWGDNKALIVHLKYVENAHADVLIFTFTDSGLELTFKNSVGMFNDNPDPRPSLTAVR